MWSPSVARFWQELEIQNPLSVFCGSCWTNCPTPPKQPAAPSLVWPPSHSASTTSLARRSPTSWALSPRKTIEEKKRTRKSGSPTESPSSHPSVSLGEGQWLFVVRSLLVVCLFVCCWGRVEVGGGGGWILFVVKKKPVSYGEPFIWPFSEFGEREEERNVWGQKEIGLVWCPLTDWPLQWEFTCPFNLLNRALCSIYKLISLPMRMPVCVCVCVCVPTHPLYLSALPSLTLFLYLLIAVYCRFYCTCIPISGACSCELCVLQHTAWMWSMTRPLRPPRLKAQNMFCVTPWWTPNFWPWQISECIGEQLSNSAEAQYWHSSFCRSVSVY